MADVQRLDPWKGVAEQQATPLELADQLAEQCAAEAGVDCFLAGAAAYRTDDPARAVHALRERVLAVSPHPWSG
jgi:hypothetical protein